MTQLAKHPQTSEFPKISMIWKSIPSQLARENKKFLYKAVKEGALTENYVLQSLIPQFEAVPRYWTQSNSPYEVDFLIQHENDIIPVEVKSDTNVTSRSLKKYKELFGDKMKLRVRFSLENLKLDDDLLNIPLFMADYAGRLIEIALGKK